MWQRDHILIQVVVRTVRWLSRVGTRMAASYPTISVQEIGRLSRLLPMILIVIMLVVIGIFIWIQVSRGEFPVLLLIAGGLVATGLALVSKATRGTRQ